MLKLLPEGVFTKVRPKLRWLILFRCFEVQHQERRQKMCNSAWLAAFACLCLLEKEKNKKGFIIVSFLPEIVHADRRKNFLYCIHSLAFNGKWEWKKNQQLIARNYFVLLFTSLRSLKIIGHFLEMEKSCSLANIIEEKEGKLYLCELFEFIQKQISLLLRSSHFWALPNVR